MKRIRQFTFEAGPVEFGSGNFAVHTDAAVLKCNASNLGEHPVCALVRTALYMHSQLFDRAFKDAYDSYTTAEVSVCDEPGGMLLTFQPQRKLAVKIAIYQIPGVTPVPSVSQMMTGPPDQEGLISFWQLVDAVYDATAEMLRRHGVSGFKERWDNNSWWTNQHDSQLFPFEHFAVLAKLKQTRRPIAEYGWPLKEEIQVLQQALNNTLGTTSNT